MRTYKENIIELADGETVIIRVERRLGQSPLQVELTAVGWYDYVGEPNGLQIATANKLDLNQLIMNEEHTEGTGQLEVKPDGLVLSSEPLLRPITDQKDSGFTLAPNQQ